MGAARRNRMLGLLAVFWETKMALRIWGFAASLVNPTVNDAEISSMLKGLEIARDLGAPHPEDSNRNRFTGRVRLAYRKIWTTVGDGGVHQHMQEPHPWTLRHRTEEDWQKGICCCWSCCKARVHSMTGRAMVVSTKLSNATFGHR